METFAQPSLNRFKKTITDKKDWYQVKNEQLEFYKSLGLKEQTIVCPAGSLVLWDSRTIHCGIEARKNRKNPKFRSVALWLIPVVILLLIGLQIITGSNSNTSQSSKRRHKRHSPHDWLLEPFH